MTWKTCQIITNGGWTNTFGCVQLCCGSASLSCVLGLFLYYVSQRRGGLGLLILGGEPIADEVCLKILFLCVSSSWWSVCKSLMLSCPSRPLMNDLSEIYFYNPTPSAFLNLHLGIYSIYWFTNNLFVFKTVSIGKLHFNISRNKLNNPTVVRQQKCEECQSIQRSATFLAGFILKLNQMMANFRPVPAQSDEFL